MAAVALLLDYNYMKAHIMDLGNDIYSLQGDFLVLFV